MAVSGWLSAGNQGVATEESINESLPETFEARYLDGDGTEIESQEQEITHTEVGFEEDTVDAHVGESSEGALQVVSIYRTVVLGTILLDSLGAGEVEIGTTFEPEDPEDEPDFEPEPDPDPEDFSDCEDAPDTSFTSCEAPPETVFSEVE